MNLQIKATVFSLFTHTMLVLSALAVGRFAVTDKPPLPLPLTFSICQAEQASASGPPAIIAPRPKTNEPEKREQPPIKAEQVPVKGVARKEEQRAIPAPVKSLPPEAVGKTVPKESSDPDNSAPIATNQGTADSAVTNTETTTRSVKELEEPHPENGGGGWLFSSTELDGSLVVVKQTQPPYPRRARRLNIEGWIKVRFIVDEDGHVHQVTILDANPKGFFEQSVLQSVDQWRFKPGTKDGRVVKTLVEQTIIFKLEG